MAGNSSVSRGHVHTRVVGVSKMTQLASSDALDADRTGSMADEGGMSGAVMESEDGDNLRSPTSHRGRVKPQHYGASSLRAITSLAACGAALLVVGLGLRSLRR